MKTFYIAMAVFVALGLLANYFWLPQYLLIGGSIIIALAAIAGFIIGVKNTVEEADKKASE